MQASCLRGITTVVPSEHVECLKARGCPVFYEKVGTGF
uniref:Uncharacterized protein n=1 Tax=Anguilla anguilla TaxID=7936 RepID=A0A0E9QFW8_ANGAN